MERHDTHILSCSSSVEHSYKFDKHGNVISDSVSEMPLNKVINKKKYKINTADIFKNIKISQEEEINPVNNKNEKQKILIDLNNNKNDNLIAINEKQKY